MFVIGAARSGTKLLRSLLASDERVSAIPYDVNWAWRDGNESLDHDEIDPEKLSDSQIVKIRRNIDRLASRASGYTTTDKIIVEKSVSNCLRVSLLYKCFPDAKFIHLVRNPYAVCESAARMWQSPIDLNYLMRKIRFVEFSHWRYVVWFLLNRLRKTFEKQPNIWGPRYSGISEDVRFDLSIMTIVARQWAWCFRRSMEQLSEIPKDQVFELSYADMVNRDETLRYLCKFANVDPDVVLPFWRSEVQRGFETVWKARLSAAAIQEIDTALSEVLTSHDLGIWSECD